MSHQKNSTLPPGVREEKTMKTLSGRHHHRRCQVWSSNSTFFNSLIQNPSIKIHAVQHVSQFSFIVQYMFYTCILILTIRCQLPLVIGHHSVVFTVMRSCIRFQMLSTVLQDQNHQRQATYRVSKLGLNADKWAHGIIV